MRYMLDTNICIYLMHHHPPEVMKCFSKLRFGEAVMSAITLAELRYGVERQPETRAHNQRALDALLTDVPALTFDENTATSYGVLRMAVKSRQRDALDRLIAAHAVSTGCILVTNNEADFKDYPGLIVENWVAANIH
ncbi:MAG: type II toxin-antitoxin system VapC family toxin [Sulfuricellaceae bacterium]